MKNFLTTFVTVSFFAGSVFAANKYFIHQKIQSSGGPTGDWSIDYVQLVPAAGKKLTPQQQEVNAKLKAAAEASVPDEGDGSYGKSDVTIKTDVTFVSPRLLAIRVNYDSYYAGAAHPNAGVTSSIYDLSLGQEIALSSGQPVGQYGEKIETPEFESLVTQKLISAAASDTGMDEDCKGFYTKDELEYVDISLSPKFITVQPSFPHAAKACEVSVQIPMKDLKNVAKPGSLLEELVKGAN